MLSNREQHKGMHTPLIRQYRSLCQCNGMAVLTVTAVTSKPSQPPALYSLFVQMSLSPAALICQHNR